MRLYIRADERRVAGLDGTCLVVRVTRLAGTAFDSLHELRLGGTDLPEDAELRLRKVAASVHIDRIQTDEYDEYTDG